MTTAVQSPHIGGAEVARHVRDNIIPLANLGDMLTVVGLLATPVEARIATALAWRGRTRADAVRFGHATDVAERMPELFTLAQESGRLAVDHLDLVWSRINRHMSTVPVSLTEETRTGLDHVVEPAVVSWLSENGEGTCTVNLADLRDLIDAVLLDKAPGLYAETARAERDSATLHRRGRVLSLHCGNELTAAGIDRALTDKAKQMIAGLRHSRDEADDPGALPPLPTRNEIKAQILMGMLGDDPETLTVRVNLFRATVDDVHGTGAAYSPEVGWLDVEAAERLEDLARTSPNGTVQVLPTRRVELPSTEAYRWPVLVQMAAESRDGHCRFPGCTVPAVRCEKDHIENSPHTDPTSNGATELENVQNLCPEHHRVKTTRLWTCNSPDGGHTVCWTGPNGEEHTTYAAGPLSHFYRDDPDGPVD